MNVPKDSGRIKRRTQKLFTVSASDCVFKVKRGSGDGGQKRQKTSSAVQCFHEPSGAMGEAEDTRNQSLNKRKAFERMFASKEFQSWLNLKIEAAKGNVEITEENDRGDLVTRPLRHDEV